MIVGGIVLLVIVGMAWAFSIGSHAHDEFIAYHTRNNWYANQMYLENRTEGKVE